MDLVNDETPDREKAREVLRGMPKSLVTVLARCSYAPDASRMLAWIYQDLEMGSKALVLAHGLVEERQDGEVVVTPAGRTCMQVAGDEDDGALHWDHKMEALEVQHAAEFGRVMEELAPHD